MICPFCKSGAVTGFTLHKARWYFCAACDASFVHGEFINDGKDFKDSMTGTETLRLNPPSYDAFYMKPIGLIGGTPFRELIPKPQADLARVDKTGAWSVCKGCGDPYLSVDVCIGCGRCRKCCKCNGRGRDVKVRKGKV